MALSSNMSITELIAKLSNAVKLFVKDMEEVVGLNQKRAPSEEIKELMAHLKEKSATDPKEKQEVEKTLGFLKLLTDDERILALVKTESEDWYELVVAIEDRMIKHADKIGPEEAEIYKETMAVLSRIKDVIRKE